MTAILVINEEIEKFRAHLAPLFADADFRWAANIAEAEPHFDSCQVLITMNYLLQPGMIARMKRLEWVQAMVAGVEDFLVELEGRDDILLTSGRGIHGPQMTENLVFHLLGIYRDAKKVVRNQDRHVWDRFTPRVLDNRTVGLVGMGVIAEHMARTLKALGMTVIGVTRTKRAVENFDQVFARDQLREVASMVDFLVLLLPLEAASEHLIDADILAAMRPDAYLINMARGGVVDQAALIDALRNRRIAGAGLDVFEEGVLPASSPLWDMENVFITPWIGGRSDQYADRILTVIEPNIRHFLAGETERMINVVER